MKTYSIRNMKTVTKLTRSQFCHRYHKYTNINFRSLNLNRSKGMKNLFSSHLLIRPVDFTFWEMERFKYLLC